MFAFVRRTRDTRESYYRRGDAVARRLAALQSCSYNPPAMTSALKLRQGRFGRAALLDSDVDLVTHTHPQCHVLVHAGGADTAFAVRGERHVLERDTLVVIDAWEPHAKVHCAGSGSSTVLALYIEPEWLAGIDPRLAVAGLRGFFPRPCVPMPHGIRARADRVVACMLGGVSPALAKWEAALSDLMLAVVHSCSAWRDAGALHRASLRRLSDPRVNRAIRYMREHLDSRLSLETLARECHVSRPHFFHLFKTCTAVPPAMYLNTLRMESAFRELPATEATINDLAGVLGFAEPQHFTRFFRNNLGIPPSEYRRRIELVP
jgi:AraC family transcriptional regulator